MVAFLSMLDAEEHRSCPPEQKDRSEWKPLTRKAAPASPPAEVASGRLRRAQGLRGDAQWLGDRRRKTETTKNS